MDDSPAPSDRTALDREAVSEAMSAVRARLRPRDRSGRPLAAVAAAALFAVSALVFAASAMLAPPLVHSEPVRAHAP